jgi:6-phosphofructokinase 2
MSRSPIVTLTMNPALDVTADAEEVRPTDKVRCHAVRYDAGGGGINVARFAGALGGDVVAVFAAGGSTGERLVDLVYASRTPYTLVPLGGATRESFTVNDRAGDLQYRFVLPGPILTAAECALCLDKLREAIPPAVASACYVVASGSLPPGVPPDFYQRVADLCREVGARLILDTSVDALTHVRSGVYLLKPSVRELRDCVDRPLSTLPEQVEAARELIGRGLTEAVVVSLGPQGAILATATESRHFPAIPVHAVSGVGAGDAMVAGIAVGLSRGWSMSDAVRYGIAAAAAKLLTPGTAAFAAADVDRFVELAADTCDDVSFSQIG